jgi:hypothetical protein
VLLHESWHVFVLFELCHRIDRRFLPMDHRFIQCYCLLFFFSATRSTLLENGPSVHPTVPWFSPSVPTRSTIATTLVIYVPSVHPTVSFLFLFFLNMACGILASLGPRNVYKDMLNNMVSSIDHAVKNHQIKLELIAYVAMFATMSKPARSPVFCANLLHRSTNKG